MGLNPAVSIFSEKCVVVMDTPVDMS